MYVKSEEYEADNITITVAMEWNQQARVCTVFNVSVLPPAPIVLNESTSLDLVLEYNTEYNLTVEVVISCGSSTIGFIPLKYGEA